MVAANPGIEGILSKAKGLLNLQTSSNVHEAALAAAKLSELLFKHNLDMYMVEMAANEDQNKKPGEPYVQNNVKLESKVEWRRDLCFYIARNNFCRTVTWQATKFMTIVGQQSNIDVVKEMFALLQVQLVQICDNEYKQYKKDSGYWAVPGKTWKNSFYLGAVAEIDRILKAQRTKMESENEESRALVLVKDDEVENAFTEMFPKLSERTRKSNIDYSAYGAGRNAAHNLNFGSSKSLGSNPHALGRGA